MHLACSITSKQTQSRRVLVRGLKNHGNMIIGSTGTTVGADRTPAVRLTEADQQVVPGRGQCSCRLPTFCVSPTADHVTTWSQLACPILTLNTCYLSLTLATYHQHVLLLTNLRYLPLQELGNPCERLAHCRTQYVDYQHPACHTRDHLAESQSPIQRSQPEAARFYWFLCICTQARI